MSKVHWRKRKLQRGLDGPTWTVRPLCNVQDVSKSPYEATTFRKSVTCRSCIRIGDKRAEGN